MARVREYEFPEDRLYDVENQIWYAPLPDGTVRAGFTSWAAALMGDVLVFTPQRIGRGFEKSRWFAMVEGGKWVGAARAAFDGTIVAQNEELIERPEMLTADAFGRGWMVIMRPANEDWRSGLASGGGIGPAVESWIAGGSYKERKG